MLAALADRERSLRSMQSGAIMEYSAADGHHFRTHEEIALARPASMRVEAVAPFGATMVLAADDAGRLMIFDPSKNVLMSGGANAATLERYVRIPLAPPAAVDLLMGLAPGSGSTRHAARLGQRYRGDDGCAVAPGRRRHARTRLHRRAVGDGA